MRLWVPRCGIRLGFSALGGVPAPIPVRHRLVLSSPCRFSTTLNLATRVLPNFQPSTARHHPSRISSSYPDSLFKLFTCVMLSRSHVPHVVYVSTSLNQAGAVQGGLGGAFVHKGVVYNGAAGDTYSMMRWRMYVSSGLVSASSKKSDICSAGLIREGE